MSIEIKGANAQAFNSREPEIILSGPANCGKTFAVLNKLQNLAISFPNLRIAFVRKTRVSMNTTILETFEEEIYPKQYSASSPIDRKSRTKYEYANGSEVHLFGMDQPDKFLGSRWDITYAAECAELTEDQWGMLKSRTQRHRGPFNQLIGDCNPPKEGEEHWIWKRHLAKLTPLLLSEHRLNPILTSGDVVGLSTLRGDLRRRFYEGSWKAIPGEGKLFKAEWFKYLDAMPKGGKWARGWDIASGESEDADETAGALTGICDVDGKKGCIVIADVTAGRWSPHTRNERMRLMAESDKALEATGYFEKGFGIGTDMTVSVLDALKGYSMWPIKPKGSKLFRADPFAGQAQAGNVYLVRGDWNYSFVKECSEFTGEEGGIDNKVDGASLAYNMLMR